MFADDSILFAMDGMDLQKLVYKFNTICRRRKLKIEVGIHCDDFEKKMSEAINFSDPYRIMGGKQCGTRAD